MAVKLLPKHDNGQVNPLGSGTNKQDMGDCEDQFQIQKRSLSWSPSPFTALDFKTRRSRAQWSRPECANSSIAAARADGKAAKSHSPCLSRSAPRGDPACKLKNASLLRGLTRTDRGFRVPPSPVGSKKPSGQRMRRDLSGKMEAKRKKCGRDKERNDEPLSKLCKGDAALVSVGRT